LNYLGKYFTCPCNPILSPRYRTPHIPNSELLAAALRYRTPHNPNSELLAAALRYRTPTSPNSYRTPTSSISDRPSTTITANCLQQRFAIALPHPKQRFLRSASLSHSQHPKKRFLRSASLSHPTSQNSELLAAALRYRTPNIPKTAIPAERFAITPPHP